MDMKDKVSDYLQAIKNDYAEWTQLRNEQDKINDPIGVSVRDAMFIDFCNTLRFEEGLKYIKVITGLHVHSFIVKKDTNKFKCGDILMAASWKAPATNFARGNIFESYKVRWSGV